MKVLRCVGDGKPDASAGSLGRTDSWRADGEAEAPSRRPGQLCEHERRTPRQTGRNPASIASGITPTFSICPNHGYLPGRQKSCPTCGAVSEVYSRVVGYLRPVNQWNEGKCDPRS